MAINKKRNLLVGEVGNTKTKQIQETLGSE